MHVLRILLAAAEARFPLHSGEEREALIEKLWNQRTYVLAALRYKLSNQQLCEDLLQDTFVAAIRSMETPRSFADEKALRNYLLTIAYNKMRDHIRAQKRSEQREKAFATSEDFEQWIENLGDERSVPEKQVLAAEAQSTTEEAVRLAMEELPPQQRQILYQRFTLEKPIAQIASEMELGFKAAESLLFRARKNFQKCFTKIMTGANDNEVNIVDSFGEEGQ